MKQAPTLGLIGLLAGCTLAPAYERPAPPIPAAFPQGGTYQAVDPAATGAPPQWRTVFLDARLQRLIQAALAGNRDLRQTVANVRAAHATFEVQRSALLPTLSAQGSLLQERLPPALGGSFEPAREYQAGLGVSSYELDLFGNERSLSRAAFQQYLASDEGRRAAQISLVAEVASAWLTVAADRELVTVSKDTAKSADQTLALTRSRFDKGVASDLDVSEAETVYAQARAGAASAAVNAAQAKDALDLLVGHVADEADLASTLEDTAPGIALVKANLKSDVLLQRPDVLQAEDQLKAANAQIGSARAAFFPEITLTGSDGFASTGLAGLFKGANNSWSFNPAITLPLFTGGRNLGALHSAEAQRDAAVAGYENAVQAAFRDVADALAAAGGTVEQLAAQQALVSAAARSLKLASARYDRGADTYLNQLDAQRTLYSAQEGLVTARLADISSRVTLYRALGGGG